MTDEELERQLGAWQVEVGAVTEQVMAFLEADAAPVNAVQLRALLDEIRALREQVTDQMQQMRLEIAALRGELADARNPSRARPTIKGYPLLPFARPEDETPFFQ